MAKVELIEPTAEWVEWTDAIAHIEKAGRISHRSEPNGDPLKFVQKVAGQWKHESILEHAWFGVRGGEFAPMLLHYIQVLGMQLDDPTLKLFSVFSTSEEVVGNLRMWTHLWETRGAVAPQSMVRRIAEAYDLADWFVGMREEEEPEISAEGRGFLTATRPPTYTAKITASRACFDQLARHRLAAFTAESQRYVNYARKGFRFVGPEECRPMFAKAAEWYMYFIETKKWKPQEARRVLPMAVATTFFMTLPKVEWERVFALRCQKDVWPETREICESLRAQMRGIE